MRILYWVGHIGNKFGAYEKYVLLFAYMCKTRGHQLIVLHEGQNSIQYYQDTLSEFGAEYVSISHTLKEPFHGLPAAINVIKEYRPDIIHFNFTNPLIVPFAKLLRVPLVYRTSHTEIPTLTARTKISRFINNFFIDRIFAVSRCVLNYEIRAGSRKDKLFLNLLGLPIEEYIQNSLSTVEKPLPTAWNDRQLRKIITVGRFFPQKGMDFVTEVAIQTMRKYPDTIWWMVGGSGPDYALCKDMVNRSHLQDRILFLGQRNDVPALLKRSYIQVVGSLFEGLPLNVLESSLLGVPTLGPRITGLDEAVKDGETGYLIGSRSVDEFVFRIGDLLDGPELRNRLGENATNYVMQNHNSSSWIGQLLDYYELDTRGKVHRSSRQMVHEKT
jgi:glycosyltransferase involved in cell wall biosynthesis